MNSTSEHTFHIPVLGLAFSIDTPIKVARFGIASVLSIVEDELLEQMRELYCGKAGLMFTPIPKSDLDCRAKRITAYLNLVKILVDEQIEAIKNQTFEEGNDIVKYFELLPETSSSKTLYRVMLEAHNSDKEELQMMLRNRIVPGEINVNIMTKIDNLKWNKEETETLPPEYAEAMSALRGYANSALNSAVVFSAGLNPRLFAYLEHFPDFFPDAEGYIKKKVILKVSDYRSALVQGKFLAKKGIWVSEFRIESGLNCGGHAFPTEGFLLGPILEEFKHKRDELFAELFALCNKALQDKDKQVFTEAPAMQISVQGGIGTAEEDAFLRNHYQLDKTGWGSPFLLVPEATNLDDDTLQKLATAKQSDYYLSHASPLGVPFNNFKHSSSEKQRLQRIDKNRPGSPCYKEHLAFNTEFTEKPICEASRKYQHLKIVELQSLGLPEAEYKERFELITEKDCLCEGLSAAALLKNNVPVPRKLDAVAICPGPNLAYFSGVFSLKEMIGHIYGRINILNSIHRPHMFINELRMYVAYLKKELQKTKGTASEKQVKYLSGFKTNLLKGIEYYLELFFLNDEVKFDRDFSIAELATVKLEVESMNFVGLVGQQKVPQMP